MHLQSAEKSVLRLLEYNTLADECMELDALNHPHPCGEALIWHPLYAFILAVVVRSSLHSGLISGQAVHSLLQLLHGVFSPK